MQLPIMKCLFATLREYEYVRNVQNFPSQITEIAKKIAKQVRGLGLLFVPPCGL